jgi:hypothetical protein
MAALAAPHDQFDLVALVQGELILAAGGLVAPRTWKWAFFVGRHAMSL